MNTNTQETAALTFTTCAQFNEAIRKVTSLDDLAGTFGINNEVALKLAIEGACRVMSKDTAGNVSIESIDAIMKVWGEGFKDKAEKAAYERTMKQAAVPSKGHNAKGAGFGRFELLGAISDLIGNDKKKQASLEKVKGYDEATFTTFIRVQGAKPGSLVAQAIANLSKAAKAKADAELAATLESLEDL